MLCYHQINFMFKSCTMFVGLMRMHKTKSLE